MSTAVQKARAALKTAAPPESASLERKEPQMFMGKCVYSPPGSGAKVGDVGMLDGANQEAYVPDGTVIPLTDAATAKRAEGES
ncbi:hypothetical protein LCGC14_2979230 [marine sediment metagenome]|uniref:Uncharacterized protein n=1 Tax=marine sediment metagenome TaxID=412755 RepID=A0A0F8ZEP1_9ZZZZ